MKRLMCAIALAGLGLGLCAGRRAAPVPPREFHPDNSIVRLVTDDGKTYCSGTVVGKHLLVTAAHCVIENSIAAMLFGPSTQFRPKILVTNASGSIRGQGTVAAASQQTDQAVVVGDFSMFPGRGLETDPARDMAAMLPGHRLMTCGYPMGGALYCNEFYPVAHHDFWIAGYANMYPGMSGGPVIDMETGKVVGINFAVEGDKALITPTLEILVHVEQSQL